MSTAIATTETPVPAAVRPGISRRAILMLEIAALVIALACLFLVDGCMLVSRVDTIFPRVRVMGTDVSGMTVTEAADALRAAGWDGADGVVLRAEFPGGGKVAVRSGTAGWHNTAREAANAALHYGRERGNLHRLMTWIKTALTGHDVGEALCAAPDGETLRTATDAAAKRANYYLENGFIDAETATLYYLKGADQLTLSEDAVYDAFLRAIEQHEPELSFLAAPESPAEPIDWQALHDRVCQEVRNAWYDAETVSIQEGSFGIAFDVAAAERLWEAAAPGDVIEVPVTLTAPDYWATDLSGLYADQLAVRTTYLGGSTYNRVNNVTLAASRIDGVILQPGETFSYNDVVGQRTYEAGFLEAGAYADGEVVQAVGGGICQVSSTLYYCAMLANLNILQRTNHYFAVNYIEPGMDATVSWGGPEFVFENNRDFPIVIRAGVSGGALTVEIWGTDVDGSYVRMSYSSSGKNVSTFRAVYDRDGNLLSNEFEAASTYHSH